MAVALNKAVFRRAAEARNRGDLDGYLKLYAWNAVAHGYPDAEPGVTGVRRYYEPFWAAWPDLRLTIEELVAAGEAIAVRYAVECGRTAGPRNTPPGLLRGIAVLRFAEGRIVERWTRTDPVPVRRDAPNGHGPTAV